MAEIRNLRELGKEIEKVRDAACELLVFADDSTVQNYLKGIVDFANFILTKKAWCKTMTGGVEEDKERAGEVDG